MRKILLPLLALIFSFASNGQDADRCGSIQMIKQQMAEDPTYAKKVKEAEKKRFDYSRPKNNEGRPTSITIPVAVHILYNSPEENISDAQVQSQINVLNEDYTATNSDYNNFNAGYGSVKGDLEIKFCLVKIIRKKASNRTFGLNDKMKYDKNGGSDAVDPMQVLNIWVCDLGKKLLGYAYYPGISPERFGVVCHINAFGKGSGYRLFTGYDLGRTVTHEVGHCFGLAHIWGDAVCGDDFVDDTPLHNEPNFGCPGEGHLSTCTGTPPEMWMNYMDYTNDKCMYFFTDGQAARADFFITTDPQLSSIVNSSCTNIQNRNSITSASGNTITSPKAIIKSEFSLYPSITTGRLTLELENPETGKAEINIYNQAGAFMMKQQILISGKINNQVDVSKLGNGIYYLELGQGISRQTKKFIVQH